MGVDMGCIFVNLVGCGTQMWLVCAAISGDTVGGGVGIGVVEWMRCSCFICGEHDGDGEDAVSASISHLSS